MLDRPMAYEPGEVFAYSTANTHLLCAVVQQATGQTLYEFGKENLFDPVGMESVTCDTDAQGISDGGNGIYMSIFCTGPCRAVYIRCSRAGTYYCFHRQLRGQNKYLLAA